MKSEADLTHMPFLQQVDSAVLLNLYIQPRASSNRFSGIHDRELKLTLTAPPVEGKANKALITFLSRFFQVSKSSISLIRGEQSRHKTCRIDGLNAAEAGELIGREILC